MSRHGLSLLIVSFACLSARVHAGPVVPGTPTPTVWFEANSITGVGNGGSVSTWNDVSGNGNNLQAISAAPTYVAGTPGTLGGKPYVDFGASGRSAMQTINNLPITGDINTTVFIVLKTASGSLGAFGWGDAFDGATGGGAFGMFTNLRGTDVISIEYGNSNPVTFGAVSTQDTFQSLEFQKAPGSMSLTTLSLDGSPIANQGSTGNTPTVDANPFVLGQWANDSSDGGLIGGVAEVIVYNSVLDPTQSAAVQAYLDAKYFPVVPEPGSVILMLLGSALLVYVGQRRRRSVSANRTTLVRITALALIATTMAAKAGSLSAAPVPAYTIANSQLGVGPNGGVVSLGYDFTTTIPLMIYAVGAFDHLGTDIATEGGGALTVDLYQNSGPGAGTLVLTSPVLSTDPATALDGGAYTAGTDAFRYDALAVPVLLPAGDYRIFNSTSASEINFAFNASGFTPISGFTNDQPVYSFSPGYAATANPANVVGDIGPNLLVGPVVPEPSTFVLGVLAAIGLVCAGRHQQHKGSA